MTACTYRKLGGCYADDRTRAGCPLVALCDAAGKVRRKAAARLTGTAGECTADLFDARESEVSLFAWAGGGKGVTA